MLTKTKIAAAAILLAASAISASAQTAGAYEPTGNGQGMWAPAEHPAARARAAVHPPVVREGPNTVIEAGHYLGQDPDPTVRMMLERDLSWQ